MMSLESSIQAFAREGFTHQFGKPAVAVKDDPEWRKLRDIGTRLWLDTGDIDEAGKLWNSSFDALTTNNTLLNKEIQKGISYIRRVDPVQAYGRRQDQRPFTEFQQCHTAQGLQARAVLSAAGNQAYFA